MQAPATHRVVRVKRAEPFRSEVVTADIVRLAQQNVQRDVVQVQVIGRVVLVRHLAPLILHLVPRAAEVLADRAVVHHAAALLEADRVSAAAAEASVVHREVAVATETQVRASILIAL